jgi:hypothetical protein
LSHREDNPEQFIKPLRHGDRHVDAPSDFHRPLADSATSARICQEPIGEKRMGKLGTLPNFNNREYD